MSDLEDINRIGARLETIGIIPARGGSKGVKKKNIALCNGHPLLHWTLEAARKSKLDRIVVTSDDDEILAYATSCDVASIKRPASLSTDEAGLEDVVMHALWTVNAPFDAFMLLQPTSPLRTAEDIDAAIGLIEQHEGIWRSVVSVYRSHVLTFRQARDGDEKTRRQDRGPTMLMNGAIYAHRLPWDRKFCTPDSRDYVMPSNRSVDIDDADDLYLAECLLKRRGV